MDDAERWRSSTSATDAAETEAWVERARKGWHEHRAEEGDAIVEHAQRVIGGEAAGHWCNCLDEQVEAARRFLADVDPKEL